MVEQLKIGDESAYAKAGIVRATVSNNGRLNNFMLAPGRVTQMRVMPCYSRPSSVIIKIDNDDELHGRYLWMNLSIRPKRTQ